MIFFYLMVAMLFHMATKKFLGGSVPLIFSLLWPILLLGVLWVLVRERLKKRAGR